MPVLDWDWRAGVGGLAGWRVGGLAGWRVGDISIFIFIPILRFPFQHLIYFLTGAGPASGDIAGGKTRSSC